MNEERTGKCLRQVEHIRKMFEVMTLTLPKGTLAAGKPATQESSLDVFCRDFRRKY